MYVRLLFTEPLFDKNDKPFAGFLVQVWGKRNFKWEVPFKNLKDARENYHGHIESWHPDRKPRRLFEKKKK